MKKNLAEEMENYVESNRGILSDRSLHVMRFALRSVASDFNNPHKSYTSLVKRGCSLYTIKTYFILAGKFEVERFRTRHYQEFLKTKAIAFKNCYREKTRFIKPEEYGTFLKMYRDANPAMYNLLVLMGMAGLRISEAMQATWEDIQDGFIKVIGKGKKQRLIPFNKNELIQTETASIVGKLHYRYTFDKDMKPFTPHDFRAYYATFIANHPDLSIKDAALLLGHADIKTTSRYVRTDLNRIAKVLMR